MALKIKLRRALLAGVFFLVSCNISSQTYRDISGWDADVNQKLERFLNSTIIIKDRKVAVFDCDGTLFGQVPYYLADEAIYDYAETRYAGKEDSLSRAKMSIIDTLLHGNNVGTEYVKRRIDFLSGLTVGEVENMGDQDFHEKYQMKFYPEMRELLANLQDYGFELWVLTASPELLYQQFVHENLGIPKNRILGVKSVISHGKITNQLVDPIPQDAGKADAIQTFIKTRPLFVAGNSRGDMEMMNESVGIKLIVNPDNEKIERGNHAGDMDGYTVKQYWQKHEGLTVYCNDVAEGSQIYASNGLKIKANKSNPKPVKSAQ